MALLLLLLDILFAIQVVIIIFSIIIYPILIKQLAKNKKLTAINYDQKDLPEVTIIIPAHNEEKYIRDKIRNTRNLDYPRDKVNIVVVDNGSTDNTKKVAKKERVKVITSKRGKINAIIEGVKHSQSKLISITDADTLLIRNALKSTVGYINRDVVAVSGYPVLEYKKSFFSKGKLRYYKNDINLRYFEGLLGSPSRLDGKFLLAKKEIFEELDVNTFCDDYEITLMIIKRGFKSVIDREAKVYENPPSTLKEE